MLLQFSAQPKCTLPNEVYTTCGGPGCDSTCPTVFSGRNVPQYKYITGKATCPAGCSTPACVCAPGYMRDSTTGQCVLIADCRKSSSICISLTTS